MFKKYFRLLPLALTALFTITAYATGGSKTDPLISVSYLDTIYTSKIDEYARGKAQALSTGLNQSISTALDSRISVKAQNGLSEQLTQRVYEAAIDKLSQNPGLLSSAGTQKITLQMGDRVIGSLGSGFVLQSGVGQLAGPSGSQIIHITAGKTCEPGTSVTLNDYYMITEDNGSGLFVTSQTATVLLLNYARTAPKYEAQYEDYATALNFLGLFLGTENGFELTRAPQRQEALILLIRLLGEEPAALSHPDNSPFTDLTNWINGRRYIAYAYEQKYTNGVSATAFSPTADASWQMFLTFVLRALGYSDSSGDFIWDQTSGDLAVQLGLLTEDQCNDMKETGLMRDHAVLICYRALYTPLKTGDRTLGEKLISNGILTEQQLTSAAALIK